MPHESRTASRPARRTTSRLAAALLLSLAALAATAAPSAGAERTPRTAYGPCGGGQEGWVYFDTDTVRDFLGGGSCLAPGAVIHSLDHGYNLLYGTDGNLVQYRWDGQVVWESRTAGADAYRASVQRDGDVVLYSPDGRAYWSTGTDGCLAPDEYSALAVQNDGNLVLYRFRDGGPWHPYWDTFGYARC